MDANETCKMVEKLRVGSSEEKKIAALELGKSQDTSVVAPLLDALSDADADVRARAAFSLSRIPSEESVPALVSCLAETRESVDVRFFCARALGQIGSRVATPALINALDDRSENIRMMACIALAELKDDSAIPALHKLLQHPCWETRWDAAHALWEMQAPNIRKTLLSLMDDPDLPGDLKYRIHRLVMGNAK